MWTKPYGMKEGFLIGGGLMIAGLMLELSVGPVDWDAFRWPVNGMVLSGFLALIAMIYVLRKRVYGFQFIGTYNAAIPALAYALVLTMVMGLTRQRVDGVWLNNMLSFWPFVLIYVYMAVILGQTILQRMLHFTSWLCLRPSRLGHPSKLGGSRCSVRWLCLRPSRLGHPSKLGGSRCSVRWRRDVPFLLNHLGLFLAMTTATLGNADMQRLKMITVKGEREWRALTSQQQIVEMPIAIELKDFIMETYDDGSPRRFASNIQILTKTGKNIETTVEVNKPVEVEGWKIYQYGYDTQMGAMSEYSILELVSDPWLPLVYTGIYMMLAGAVCMFIWGGVRRGGVRREGVRREGARREGVRREGVKERRSKGVKE